MPWRPMADDPKPTRDAKGHFLPGHKFAKGNPIHRRMHAYREAWSKALTPEMVAGVMHAMVRAALQGDVAAARLVFQFVGKPPEELAISMGTDARVEQLRAQLADRVLPRLPGEDSAG